MSSTRAFRAGFATQAIRCFAVAAALSLLVPIEVRAQSEGVVQEMIPDSRDITRAARLRTSLDPTDPDTVWIGHIDDATFTAGGTMVAGGYGPYHVGRGPNRPKRAGAPVTIGDNGAWSFDRFQFSENDSLQGWWPLAHPYQSGATTFGDFKRAFFGLDYGNQVNYVINQGAPKRTFGVVGLWHRDRGNTTTYAPTDSIAKSNVQNVAWSPTEVGGAGSTASAWMGMRCAGDLSHRDLTTQGGTGNAFNGNLLDYQGNNGFNSVGSVAVNGTDHELPGYGSQMDQMLYRDVQLAEGDGLNISFNFSTNMSTGKSSTPGAEIGWFDKDPISNAQLGVGSGATPTSDGNFISAAVAGAAAPCDSFMVYVGAPVNDANVVFSAPLFVGGNEITTVYDKKRRWFSEVLKITGPGGIVGREILSAAGIHPPTPVSVDVGALYPAALQAIKDADGVGGGGKVRIVFRVKTNRGFDDENGGNPSAAFNSGTRGAAIVDNIVVNGWAAANGDFEAANSIDNDTTVDPLNAWKSTGKPPAVYFHLHSVAPGGGLVFNDPCGGLDNPNRTCNLYGNVATPGDHDNAEKTGGLFGSNTQDQRKWFASPTVNLCATGNGPGFYNAMGIDDEIARTTGDYSLFFSIYNGGLVNAPTATGIFYSLAYQSYPARAASGNICWGEVRRITSITSYLTRGCFETFLTGAKTNSLIRTTNPQNRPDSLRAYIDQITRCYSFTGLNAATCSPTAGDNVGIYYDNISLALIDAPAPPGISIPIWMLINDAFPSNGNSALIPAGFDTCAAQIRIGFNIAAQTGNTLRPSISGDSMVVIAGGNNVRLDMVFRILPGPGNYVTTGSKASGVAKRPDVAVKVAATPGDGTFFGEYMASTGAFGSQATHPSGGTVWSQHVWNSARCDTVEQNLFPSGTNSASVGLAPGSWASMYNELDPKFATLGITKNRCVMVVPGGATNSTNIVCNGSGWGAYGAGSGWDGVTTTREYTKILPDGLLTPGSHVQYFFRKCDVSNPTVFEMGPDTNFILQPSEGSSDGHRWQQFGVLPDRWKDGAWSVADRNAPAPACMLYIDWEDRRGDERYWVGIADTIGMTSPSRFGAHNGWHARGDQDITVAIATDPTIAVYTHGGQPGTLWDMYGVKASESSTTSPSLGNRSAAAATGLMAGKENRYGPSGDMLRNYYRILLILTGDLAAGNIGPYTDKGDNDVGLLQDFASGVAGTTQPRMVWAQGENFIEGQIGSVAVVLQTLAKNYFGADLASGDYRSYAGNTNDIVDLIPNAPTTTSGNIYGVANDCGSSNDVLKLSGTFGAAMAAKYADTGTNPNPKIASIYAPSSLPSTAHPMVTLVDGWRISSLGGRNTLSSQGRIVYFADIVANMFGALNCFHSCGPFAMGETPNDVHAIECTGVGETPGGELVYSLALRSENPMRDGLAKITFGIIRREKVEMRVYDVAGRLVRTLANREFVAGSHDIYWDGSDEQGRPVSRGVYFYQLRTPSFVSQKKLAMLKN